MSKYIKLEDAIGCECPFMEIYEDCINCPLYNGGSEVCEMGKWLKSLPTIEVREYADKEQAYMEGYAKGSVEGYLNGRASVEVSEDCISRADLIESFLADSECKREEAKACMCSIDFMLELIETAPSVIPTTEPQMEYKKWETPPKVKNEGIITTCVGVPVALIEDELQTESEDVE